MSRPPILELRSASKVYPGTPPVIALQETSLRIERGEQLAVVGASGSGKSTLLAILGTLDDPTTGTVLVDGQPLDEMREAERSAVRATRISFVFQQFHLLPTVSAVENVATGLIYTGVSAAARRERAVAALQAVGLGHRLRNRPGELSGGEQQRVAIARALVREPDVLFADEPTGALDSVTGDAIVELLSGIAETGTAVVLVTHDQLLADRFPRRIRLKDGRIVGRDAVHAEPRAEGGSGGGSCPTTSGAEQEDRGQPGSPLRLLIRADGRGCGSLGMSASSQAEKGVVE
ncbi:ABC transporter ATP-binding protein [Tessaracoccus caeni]|uniref:ABC transporter ATP-binding protein n=1 Tax=Tessaracoccus caeni TaxID=3031239 RepID=UPI0029E7F2F5|nr:ABC transporter ATP-binding protein [Tessaracoccus caeni]